MRGALTLLALLGLFVATDAAGRSADHSILDFGFRISDCSNRLSLNPKSKIQNPKSKDVRFTTARAVGLLRRGERAERSGIYSGVKVIQASCSDHSGRDYHRKARIWHGGPRQTRLEFLRKDGSPAPVVVENGSRRWLYSPRRRLWRPICWHEPEPRLDLLLRNYRVLPGRVEVIAGRRVLRILIEPRFPGNPRKHSWLDLATGVALRSDLYNNKGCLVSTSAFLEFRPQRSLPSSLFSIPAGSAMATREVKERTDEHLSFEPALPRFLPRGYVLDRIDRSLENGKEVAQAHYTDGLNSLSLIQWRGSQEPKGEERERFWAPGERINWKLGSVSVMLAGDLNPAELRRVAQSIRARPLRRDRLMAKK
jgi:hypothetical protein